MADDAISRHFFHGFIRLHILYHAVREPVYGAEIAKELVRHGYRLSQGTLYPTLHLLEGLGYLRSRVEFVRGRRRRYYEATARGRRVLAQVKMKLQELVAEVLEEDDQPFETIRAKHGKPRARTKQARGRRVSS